MAISDSYEDVWLCYELSTAIHFYVIAISGPSENVQLCLDGGTAPGPGSGQNGRTRMQESRPVEYIIGGRHQPAMTLATIEGDRGGSSV